MKDILIFKSVSKSFGKKQVLKDINISIKKGSFTTVIGCNGAGKSTMLRIMAGLEERSGDVFYDNVDPYSFRSTLSAEIFLVHENLPINFHMSAGKFIKVYREVFPKWDQSVFEKHIQNRELDLNSRYSDFSRGQKMQFVLSMALASGAGMLLCDEVTSMLDFDAQFYFLEALKQFAKKDGTVVMTTNILAELEDYADHVVLIQNNEIAIESSLDKLNTEYKIIRRTSKDSFFDSSLVTAVRAREGISDLYIVRTQDIPIECQKDVCQLHPKIEDFLLMNYKKKVKHENLVA